MFFCLKADAFRRSARLGLFTIAAMAATLATAEPDTHLAALDKKSDAAVRKMVRSDAGKGRLIVRLKNGVTPIVRRDLVRLGGSLQREFPAIRSTEIELPISSLSELARLNWVERISMNTTVEKSDAFTISGSMASDAWSKFGKNGTGVTVAVVDSGVSQHVDMLGHVDQVGFLLGANGNALIDDCGHGTHVAGIIAGNGLLSSGRTALQTFYGVARGANILSIRVLDREGRGRVGDVLAGLQWSLDNRKLKNIRVMNISLGHVAFESYKDDPLCQMVEKLWKAGIVVVCAAGNDGRRFDTPQKGYDNEGFGANYGSINSPGNSPYVITVGAMKRPGSSRDRDQIATYSGRGPTVFDHFLKPDIVAPGNRVVSLGYTNSHLNDSFQDSNQVPIAEYQGRGFSLVSILNKGLSLTSAQSSSYFLMSGSSMAAPVVSGAVALMLDAQPKLTPDQVKARLMLTATKWTDSNGVYDPCSLGAGYLNILEAMKSKATTTGFSVSPKLGQDKAGVFIDVKSIFGRNGIWGTGTVDPRVIWGSRSMLTSAKSMNADTRWSLNADVSGGTRAVWGHTLATEGTRAVWGSTGSDSEGTRAVWGHGSAVCDLSSIAITGE